MNVQHRTSNVQHRIMNFINSKKDCVKQFNSSKFDSAESFDPESFNPELATEGLVAGCSSLFCSSFVLNSIKRSVINWSAYASVPNTETTLSRHFYTYHHQPGRDCCVHHLQLGEATLVRWPAEEGVSPFP